MSLGSLLKIKYKGIFFFAIFYLIAGFGNIAVLGLHGLGLFHVALVAILSFLSAYGLYRLQSWTLWFVVGLFFITTTYAAFMLNAFWERYTLTSDVSSLFAIVLYSIYSILTWIATIFITVKRKHLQ